MTSFGYGSSSVRSPSPFFVSLPVSRLSAGQRGRRPGMYILIRALGHMTGSDIICGEEKLGMGPVAYRDEEEAATSPLGDKIFVPRMITSQLDTILHDKIDILSKRWTKMLDRFLVHKQPRYWFSLLLACSVVIYEISFIANDRRRHAIENGHKVRADLPTYHLFLNTSIYMSGCLVGHPRIDWTLD